MRSLTSGLFAAAAAWLVLGAAQRPADDPSDAEAQRSEDSLIADGYNFTQRWHLAPHPDLKRIRFEVLVPEEFGEHSFAIRVHSAHGQFSLWLVGPDGDPRMAWTGRKGEATTVFSAPLGTYVLEIDQPAGSVGTAVLGIKGAVLHRCEIDESAVEEHPASPARGFDWPYLLWRPRVARGSPSLLVVPDSSGFTSVDPKLLGEVGRCEIKRQNALATTLGVPLLVPLFPRPMIGKENLYLQALTRPSLQTTVEGFKRVDLQLLAMIDDARAALHAARVDVGTKVLLSGFSASGMFVNRFAMIHPDRVRAVACGSPGGWPLAPVDRIDSDELTYPVGIADLKDLVGALPASSALKAVSWLFYLGDQDRNDSVPFRDGFSEAQEGLIFKRFGTTPVSRWKRAEALYRDQGLHADFRLYPGVSHFVSSDMAKDVALFLEKAVAATN